MKEKILLCISGASLAHLGINLANELAKTRETYLIISKSAKVVLKKEYKKKFKLDKRIILLKNSDISACTASGSFGINKTIVLPCSINTLAKIANGIADNLITRSCAVALKERRKLILALRELPLSTITCKQSYELSSLGAIIAPPIMASYAQAKSRKNMENFLLGKWLDLLEVEHKLYKKWS